MRRILNPNFVIENTKLFKNGNCIKFFSTSELTKEWNSAFQQKVNAQKELLNSQLSEYEKKEVQFLLEKIKSLSKEEKLYYLHLVKTKTEALYGVELEKIDATLPSMMVEYDSFWPKNNPNWFNTPNLNATIQSFAGKVYSGGAVQVSSEAVVEKKKEEAPKEEKKVEKAAYDVKLASFDAAKKIALIKEVRTWLNLGLKEAKELVEKAPTDLKKSVKKEEAEEIKKKFSESGAVVELV